MRRPEQFHPERPFRRPVAFRPEHLLDPELWCLLCIGILLVLAP